MARKPIKKELSNCRLLKDYASWIYCGNCGRTVAYLCYVTYDSFEFEYDCKCSRHGSVRIAFENEIDIKASDKPLLDIKNRLCCANDNSPLATVVDKNLDGYKLKVVCNKCNTEYNLKS